MSRQYYLMQWTTYIHSVQLHSCPSDTQLGLHKILQSLWSLQFPQTSPNIVQPQKENKLPLEVLRVATELSQFNHFSPIPSLQTCSSKNCTRYLHSILKQKKKKICYKENKTFQHVMINTSFHNNMFIFFLTKDYLVITGNGKEGQVRQVQVAYVEVLPLLLEPSFQL